MNDQEMLDQAMEQESFDDAQTEEFEDPEQTNNEEEYNEDEQDGSGLWGEEEEGTEEEEPAQSNVALNRKLQSQRDKLLAENERLKRQLEAKNSSSVNYDSLVSNAFERAKKGLGEAYSYNKEVLDETLPIAIEAAKTEVLNAVISSYLSTIPDGHRVQQFYERNAEHPLMISATKKAKGDPIVLVNEIVKAMKRTTGSKPQQNAQRTQSPKKQLIPTGSGGKRPQGYSRPQQVNSNGQVLITDHSYATKSDGSPALTYGLLNKKR